jgi:signal transduction histidine kinase
LGGFRNLFGGRAATPVPVNLNQVVEDALRVQRRAAADSGVVLQVQLASNLPVIIGDGAQLVEVVINLVQNAIEALDISGSEDRLVRIGTQQRGNDAVSLTVEDSGPGIASNRVNTVFDAFVTTKPRGMGLGLAICRMIVERHDGSISVAQVDPHGAAFRVILPVPS